MIDTLTNAHRFLYDDAFEIGNGYIYKVVGDMHPPWGVISLLEYVPWPGGRRFGYEKTFDFLIPQLNRRVSPVFPQWFITLYGRAFEVVPVSDIRRRFEPEAASIAIAARRTDGERAADELLHAFSEASGVRRREMGLNGSWALGLATDESNVNIDIIGAEASVKAMRFLSNVGRHGPQSGFQPPGLVQGRNADALVGLWKDAFAQKDEAETYRLLGREGRLSFSGFYAGRPFTIQIHSQERDGPRRELAHPAGSFIRRTLVEGDITDRTGLLSYHSPCSVGLANVRDCLLGIDLDVEGVTSWSKRFWYTRPGDRVCFLADLFEADEQLGLAVPAFGGNWTFLFKHRAEAAEI